MSDLDYAGLIHAISCDNKTEGDAHRFLKVPGPAVLKWFEEHDDEVRSEGWADGYFEGGGLQ